MSSKMDSAQKEKCQEAFKFFDKNGDGTISVTELGEAMKQLGENPSQDDLDFIISVVDTDKSGSINYAEFEDVVSRIIDKA